MPPSPAHSTHEQRVLDRDDSECLPLSFLSLSLSHTHTHARMLAAHAPRLGSVSVYFGSAVLNPMALLLPLCSPLPLPLPLCSPLLLPLLLPLPLPLPFYLTFFPSRSPSPSLSFSAMCMCRACCHGAMVLRLLCRLDVAYSGGDHHRGGQASCTPYPRLDVQCNDTVWHVALVAPNGHEIFQQNINTYSNINIR